MSADKPDPGENEQISLKVAGQDGNEVVFKVKKTTIFKKIFEAYAQKMGRPSNVFKFSFEGTRLEPDQTPADAGLENDDIIDVMAEQTGGHK